MLAICGQALDFIRDLFRIYLEEKNFVKLIPMLDRCLHWSRFDGNWLCLDYPSVLKCLQKEADVGNGKSAILAQWYQAVTILETYCIVYGELEIEATRPRDLLRDRHFYFMMLCQGEGSNMTLLRAHFSATLPAAPGQAPGSQESRLPEKLVQCILADLAQLNRKNEELLISKKRYDIAMEHSSVMVFDYLLANKQIIHPQIATKKYGLTDMLESGVESCIAAGIIQPNSVAAFREVYQRIDQGEPTASARIFVWDIYGEEAIYELHLTNIYDKAGHPVQAVGILQNISDVALLEKEKQYGQAMVTGKVMCYEVNITRDRLETMDDSWADSLQIPHFQIFSEMIGFVATHLIHPDYAQKFKDFSSKEAIMQALSEGKKRVIVEYRRKDKNGRYIWLENAMNIICEDISREIKIRCYINDISEKKASELKTQEEQRFHQAILSKSAVVYEANLTRDQLVRGHEEWEKLFNVPHTNNYTEMMAALAEKVIYPGDKVKYSTAFSRENVIQAFFNGVKSVCCQYRRSDGQGQTIWVSCTMHLLEDPETKEIKGFSYVQNIHQEKLQELALRYKAEHDALTGMYNKSVTEQCINEYLQSVGDCKSKQAFFILDMDAFKEINDNFGHAFGDVVLSKAAKKIKDLFREDDLIGRIGGDEFVVLMKNVPNRSTAAAKAGEIGLALREHYAQGCKQFHISISMGIALFPEQGKDYQALYDHSDAALYAAKKNGRDQHCFYSEGMGEKFSLVRKIDTSNLLETKPFENNISEYIFYILYESSHKAAAINSVLELVGKHYNVSRAYIFETSADRLSSSNTFEWCNEGIEPQMANLQNISYAKAGNYEKNFDALGIFYLPTVMDASPEVRHLLEPQNIKSLLQFAILKNDQLSGFVGYDQCQFARVFSKREMTELKNIANILGVFLLEMRYAAQIEQSKALALSIVNGLDSYAYVIDQETFELLFINEKTRQIAENIKVGEKCYRGLWQRESPCAACPMGQLSVSGKGKSSMELFNDHFQIWVKATASWIHWIDGKRACLVDSMDITSYKSPKPEIKGGQKA